MHTLRPPLEVNTPHGWGHAILVESDFVDAYWTVILADTLAIVTYRQSQLTVCRNYTMGWNFTDEQLAEIIRKHREPKRTVEDS